MENSLMANLQRGAERDDLLAGLAYSIVQNYINRVVAGKHIGKNIFFQGGVAFNKSVVAAFEKYLDLKVTVPPNHDVTGAIGMALIAMRHMLRAGKTRSTFKGFDLSKRPYSQSSFECKGCPNLCEINKVKIEGDKGKLLYGGRCEKYDIRKVDTSHIPDLFKFREEALLSTIKEPTGRRPLIGIPRMFFFNEVLPFWSTLLDELGFDVYVSPVTNRQIVDVGLETVLSEACFPVKVALGHIRHVMEQEVDAILLPSFMNMNQNGGEYPTGFACPHTQTIPYVAEVAIEGLKTIAPRIDLTLGKNNLVKEIKRAFSENGLRLRRGRIAKAIERAEQAQEGFNSTLREKGREVLSGIKGKSIVIVGRSYNSFERGMNLQIPEKLATLGKLAIPMEMLPLDSISLSETWPNMYWRSGQAMLRAARYIAGQRNLYPLFIGNFSCGPDSFILKFFSKELMGKPFLHIEIDEHSADAGAITRCEAFLDSIENRDDAPAEAPAIKTDNNGQGLKGRKIYIPRMADHAFALAAAFEKAGVRAEVLPESDRETVDIGMRFVSGKECYPCIVTTGDMVKRTMASDFKPEESVFFMPSGGGPCRFGQYNIFHKQVLESVGLRNVPVYAPNQDDGFYNDLGIVSKDFAMHSWQGIMAIDLLYKCLHETRPYEKERGASDALYKDYLDRIYKSMAGMDGNIEDLLVSMRKDFENVPKSTEKRPLIGIIGEIFVRTNRFSNEDLIKKIEDLGGEAWLAPLEEWIFYVNYMGLRKALRKRERSVIIDTLLKRYYQKRIEHKYGHYFEGFLRTLREPSTRQILKKANRYVHNSFEGETVLSIGKAIDLAERGSSGVVNSMPFGCMPGTIVTALMRAVTLDYDMPSISIPYDGTESSTLEIQLEAFMDQALSRMKKRGH
jgi:predicted nucleotide-binding protein (sugar kinase/HSP70/actin superfamily)